MDLLIGVNGVSSVTAMRRECASKPLLRMTFQRRIATKVLLTTQFQRTQRTASQVTEASTGHRQGVTAAPASDAKVGTAAQGVGDGRRRHRGPRWADEQEEECDEEEALWAAERARCAGLS